MKRWGAAIAALVGGSLLLLAMGCGPAVAPTHPTKRIAVYSGTGTYPGFALATKLALDSAGRTADLVDEYGMQRNLSDYGMVVIPGGDPVQMANALSYTGRERIRALVNNGGGFIGLGGGSYLAADTILFGTTGTPVTSIGFYLGNATGPIPTISPSGYRLASVTISDDRFDPELLRQILVLYDGGPVFNIEEGIETQDVAEFSIDSTPCIRLFSYGAGRVAVCSLDPEIDVNSNVDSTDFGSELVDSESDWFLVQRMATWCFQEVL